MPYRKPPRSTCYYRQYVREGYFGSQVTAHYDLAYMALWNIALTLFGLAQVRKVSRIVVPE